MASSVFYKFSSRKDESRVTFDGTGISVSDLKNEIILANNMGKANDFDLHIFDATSKQGKCSQRLAIPLLITPNDRAQGWLSNHPSFVVCDRQTSSGYSSTRRCYHHQWWSRNDISQGSHVEAIWHKRWTNTRFQATSSTGKCFSHHLSITQSTVIQSTQSPTPGKSDEAAAMAAMFQAQTQNWEEAQEKMSQLVLPIAGFCLRSSSKSNDDFFFSFLRLSDWNSATRIHSSTRGTGFSRGGKPHTPHVLHSGQNDRPLPPSYVCYRCGQKGLLPIIIKMYRSWYFYKVIGYKIVLQTMIASSITDHE